MPTPAENAIWEGRARIMWGEAPDAVAQWMRNQGVENRLVEETIRTCLKERDAEVRRRGLIQTLSGVGIVGAAVAAYIAMISTGYVVRPVFVMCLLAGLYGSWQLANGAFLLFSGASARGSVGAMGSELD
jgi:hypothetical protein